MALAGDFTDMEEFVVQDVLQLGTGSEASLLQLRFDSPALMDSVGSDFMNRAGASDAARPALQLARRIPDVLLRRGLVLREGELWVKVNQQER